MNNFLKEFKDRGYFYQCTDEIGLSKLLNEKSNNVYIDLIVLLQVYMLAACYRLCLRLLQKHGHRPIVLLGGGTTRIGDPSGKEETRKILSENNRK